MVRISAVEGASGVLRGNTLWIKTASAFVVRAPAGQIRLAPATLSPCEAWFGVHEAGEPQNVELRNVEFRRGDLD